jgi:hypothetical protein
MNKNFRIIDDALPNPFEVKEFLKSLTHFTTETYKIDGLAYGDNSQRPDGYWRGFRSVNVYNKDRVNTELTLKYLLKKVFHMDCSFNSAEAYSHFTTDRMHKEIPPASRWHPDNVECAGVLYLNENPPKHSGTFINVNGEIIEVENKFNRLVVYHGGLHHAPGVLFGEDASNARHTYSIFIKDIKFNK